MTKSEHVYALTHARIYTCTCIVTHPPHASGFRCGRKGHLVRACPNPDFKKGAGSRNENWLTLVGDGQKKSTGSFPLMSGTTPGEKAEGELGGGGRAEEAELSGGRREEEEELGGGI